jgi:hypothetical protein
VASTSNGTPPKPVRCAIYTRKSTEEGLNQDFNSLDAQREAAEAYIRSQAGEGWTRLPGLYDDGGYTGANMDRPALRRLLADIQARKVDCVVVYKVDRLSRSIRDFGKIMEILEKHGATFVSVTQQFNTTTSLGRLTLNILLCLGARLRPAWSPPPRRAAAATEPARDTIDCGYAAVGAHRRRPHDPGWQAGDPRDASCRRVHPGTPGGWPV